MAVVYIMAKGRELETMALVWAEELDRVERIEAEQEQPPAQGMVVEEGGKKLK